MNDFRDRGIENALEEKLGAKHAPDLSARILQAARENGLLEPAAAAVQVPGKRTAGRRFTPRHSRANRSMAIYGAAMILSVVVAAALLVVFGDFSTRTPNSSTSGAGDHKSNAPAVEPAHTRPEPKAPEIPEAAPANTQPERAPEKPDEKPPVERPIKPPVQPEPEKPVDPPTKPDEVEKPVDPPKEPEKTEPKPIEKRVAATLIAAPKQAKLRVRYAENETWRELAENEALTAGVWIQSAAPVDLSLPDTTLLRLDGEIQFGAMLQLLKGQLYVDNLGCAALAISRKLMSLNLGGAAVFDLSGESIEIACLQGSVIGGGREITSGNSGTMRSGNLGSIKPSTPSRSRDAFLKGLPIRTLLRADFAEKPSGLLREGEIADGAASGPRIFWSFGGNQQVLPGSVIRLRIRVTGAEKINFSLFAPERDDNFGNDGVAMKPGEWIELEIELSAFKDRRTHKEALAIGEEYMNVQIWMDKEGAKLELDWIEFARRPAK
jgi:hypothetical protein